MFFSGIIHTFAKLGFRVPPGWIIYTKTEKDNWAGSYTQELQQNIDHRIGKKIDDR